MEYNQTGVVDRFHVLCTGFLAVTNLKNPIQMNRPKISGPCFCLLRKPGPLGKQYGQRGVTLVEMLVAMVASGIVLAGIAYLFGISLRSYRLQNEITEMHQNAHYTIKRLSEVFMEAGSDLPDTGIAIISRTAADNVTLIVNPRGGVHDFSYDIVTATATVPLDDASGFLHADSVIHEYASGSAPELLGISSVDTSTVPNTLTLSAACTYARNDALYSFERRKYYHDNVTNNLVCLARGDTTVLSEDIESITFDFYDKDRNNANNSWDDMLFVTIALTAKTPLADNRYTHPTEGDGYRRLSLDMELRLRNRF